MAIQPVDLHLRIQTRREAGQTLLDFDLSSPSEFEGIFRRVGSSRPLPLEPTPLSWQLLEEIEGLLRGLWNESILLVAEVENRLRTLGKSLYSQLLPENLQHVLDRTATEGRSLLVETDETWIPWELLHTLGDSGGFLCVRYRLGRWLPDPSRPDPCGPASSFRIGRLLCIDAGNADTPKLSRSGDEVARIRELAGRLDLDCISPETASYNAVMDRLRAGGFQLLHFAGHGRFPEGRSAELASLVLEQQSIAPMDLVDEVEKRLRIDRPLIFLNACRSGRQGMSLSGLGGWPQAFVRRGCCGALLAPQWAVPDPRAFDLAASFYRHLEQDLSLGEAVRRARFEKGTHQLDPTSLAYAFYGHPNATVIWGEAASAAHDDPSEACTSSSQVVVAKRKSSEWPSPRRVSQRNRRIMAAVALGVLTLLGVLIARRSNEPGALYERKAAAAVQERDYVTARVRLEKSVALEPDRASAWSTLGLVYGALDELQQAVAALELAVELQPEEPLFHFNLGTARADAGDAEGAARAYAQATELDPTYAGAWNNLGLLHLEKGDLDAAAVALNQADSAARLGDDSRLGVIIQKNQGRLALARGDPSLAIQLLDRANQRFAEQNDVHYPEALYYLADAWTRTGDPAAACVAWQRYVETGAPLGPVPVDLDCAAPSKAPD